MKSVRAGGGGVPAVLPGAPGRSDRPSTHPETSPYIASFPLIFGVAEGQSGKTTIRLPIPKRAKDLRPISAI